MFNNFNDLKSFIESQRRSEKKESLSYMYKLCEVFGNPQTKKQFIHIGGTNGKGSTVTYVKSILLASGLNVGTYISPYVVCFNERITYNNNYISNDDVLKYGNLILSKYDELNNKGLRTPSFFEFMTLMAFLYFSEIEDLDIAVIEVGIGGLLDCTNIITPKVSAITNVSYDHMEILGNTLGEIWDNKLGIVKRNIPFVTINTPDYLDKIKNKCHEFNSKLTLVDKNNIANLTVSTNGATFDYLNFKNLSIKLLGFHQVENAILSIEIIKNLNLNISEENIRNGLNNAFWPGRLEVVSKEPLIIIDGAHNIDGITRLNEFIQKIKNGRYIRLIFAVSSNKEKDEMIKILEKNVEEMIFTHFMYKRSDESINLYNLSHHQNKKIIDDLDKIINLVVQDKSIVNIFCGSLFFISEVRNKFN